MLFRLLVGFFRCVCVFKSAQLLIKCCNWLKMMRYEMHSQWLPFETHRHVSTVKFTEYLPIGHGGQLPPLFLSLPPVLVYHKKWQIYATFCSCWIKDWVKSGQAPGWAAIHARFQVTGNITHTRRGPQQRRAARTQSQLAIIKLRRDISF